MEYAEMNLNIGVGITKQKCMPIPINAFTVDVQKREGCVVVCDLEHLLELKVHSVLGYSYPLLFLPNFVDVPETTPVKSDKPSVVFLGRLDRVKNPELTIMVAKKMPDVDFYILGSTSNLEREKNLLLLGKNVGNLHFLGHDSGDLKEAVLSKAWILINTSFYECLPISFLEALAHKCALLSTQNPDDYTAMFGCYEPSFKVEDLVKGLLFLIRNDLWKTKAEGGYIHVKQYHRTEICIQQHLSLYRRLLS